MYLVRGAPSTTKFGLEEGWSLFASSPSYLLPISLVADDFLVKMNAKIYVDVASLKSKELNRIPPPDVWARRYNKLEGDTNPSVLDFHTAVSSLTEDRSLSLVPSSIVRSEMEDFEDSSNFMWRSHLGWTGDCSGLGQLYQFDYMVEFHCPFTTRVR